MNNLNKKKLIFIQLNEINFDELKKYSKHYKFKFFNENFFEKLVITKSEEKYEYLKDLGLERVINYNLEDFESIIKNEYKGVDVILDMVGGDYFQKNINVLNRLGRLLNIAYLKGSKVEVNLLPIMLKRLTVSGSTLRIRSNDEKKLIADNLKKHIWPLIENGNIKLHIDQKFDYENVQKAHQYMENNKNIGKLLLKF